MTDVMPRFNCYADWELFQHGDRSKAIWPFIKVNKKAVFNPAYTKAPFGLTLVKVTKQKVVKVKVG